MNFSLQCGLKVALVLLDSDTQRMTYYTSSEDFDITKIRLAKEISKQLEKPSAYERYTNADYDTIMTRDFRTGRTRYNNRHQDSDGESSDEDHIKNNGKMEIDFEPNMPGITSSAPPT